MYRIGLLFTIFRAPYACLTFILIHFMQFIYLTSFLNSKLMYACCRVQLFKLLYYIMMKHNNYLWCSCCKVLFSKAPWPAIYLLTNLKGMFFISVHDMFFYFIKTNIKLIRYSITNVNRGFQAPPLNHSSSAILLQYVVVLVMHVAPEGFNCHFMHR